MAKNKLDRDAPLTAHFLERWKKLVKELEGFSPIIVPRFDVNSCYLSGFCDAAYAAVINVKTIIKERDDILDL